MFEIDLFKGQGIPIKSRPGGAAFIAIIIAVPVITTMLLVGDYFRGRIILKTQLDRQQRVEKGIEKFEESRIFQENAQKKLNHLKTCISEVGDNIGLHVQWSPVLEALSMNLPPGLTLEQLDVKTEPFQKEIEVKEFPGRKIKITVPQRVLYITFYGKMGQRSNKQALEFLRSLGNSEQMKERIDSIRMLSQMASAEDDKMVYTIECVFKAS